MKLGAVSDLLLYVCCTVGSACSLFRQNSPEIRGCEFPENLEPSEFV
jgi:hypothetical protein